MNKKTNELTGNETKTNFDINDSLVGDFFRLIGEKLAIKS